MEARPRHKAMTLRIDLRTAEELEALAQIEGKPVSEVIRDALARHIEACRADPGFRQRLLDSMERNLAILERFSR